MGGRSKDETGEEEVVKKKKNRKEKGEDHEGDKDLLVSSH